MNKSSAALFLNKEVQIYPGDTHRKTGIVKQIDENGVTFEVTSGTSINNKDWVVGKLRYIAFSARLSMQEI